jgi:hypothetical protein
MPPGSTYRMVTPEGVAVDVPADQVDYAKSRGYDFETGVDLGQRLPREAATEAAEDRGLLGSAGAFAAGAARGASFGLTDDLLPDLGITSRKELRDLKEQHRTASTLGEIGGAVAPALLSGGTSTVGTLARFTPSGAVSRVAARVAAPGGITRAAASGALEGAAQNVGAYWSDVALGDKELSAEGFLGAGAEGAAWGGAFGGGLGAAERGFVKARDLLPKFRGTKEEALRAADDLDVELQRAMSAGDDAAKSARDQLELMRLQRAELDVRAQELVVQKRAADAAAAQSRATAAEQRRLAQEARANAPRRGGRGKTKADPAPDAPPTAETPATPAVTPTPADDVVGAPIGNVPPSADGDLAALLGQSVDRAKAGASMADLAQEARIPGAVDDLAGRPGALIDPTYGRRVEPIPGFESATAARPPSALDEIHEAMAELDPDAARLVNAVKAQEAAAEVLNRRFRVRAPQQVGGLETKAILDAPNLTLGRVKTMYEKANDAEKLALLQQIGPEKSKALLEIVEGKAGFAKWYKNKAHWWDDPSYRPLPQRVGPAADDLGDLAPRVMPGTEGAAPAADDLARIADDEAEALDDMNRAIAEISEYERTVSDLATVLGPTAPPTAMEHAARFGAAADDQLRRQTDRMAQIADDAPIPDPVLAQGSGPTPIPDAPPLSPTPMSDALGGQMARDAAKRQAVDTVSLPGAPTKPAKKGGLLSTIADLGAANEALQAVGVNLPVPDVEGIPLIGPLLGAYFKLRAGATVLSRAGFRVPFVGEAKVAAGAAKTRDRMASAVDGLLGLGAKATKAARAVVAAQAWRIPDVLDRVLFDDEQPKRRKSTQEPAELVKRRVEELQRYEQSPDALAGMVRKQLHDVRNPDVIAAVVGVKQRQLDYLAKHAPVMPPKQSLVKQEWRISPAEIERFARRVRAAHDPASVLEDVATGRVTPEAAETLREVYPRLYAEAQQRLIEQAPKLQRSLPYATLVRLSMLFDAPLSPTLEPDKMARIQAAGAPTDPVMPPAPTGMAQPPPAGAPDLSSFYATPGEQRAMR